MALAVPFFVLVFLCDEKSSDFLAGVAVDDFSSYYY